MILGLVVATSTARFMQTIAHEDAIGYQIRLIISLDKTWTWLKKALDNGRTNYKSMFLYDLSRLSTLIGMGKRLFGAENTTCVNLLFSCNEASPDAK